MSQRTREVAIRMALGAQKNELRWMFVRSPSVCRKCYVHPAVLDCYLAGKLERRIRRKIAEATDGKAEEATDEVLREAEEESLQKEERAMMDLLREQLETRRNGSNGTKARAVA